MEERKVDQDFTASDAVDHFKSEGFTGMLRMKRSTRQPRKARHQGESVLEMMRRIQSEKSSGEPYSYGNGQ